MENVEMEKRDKLAYLALYYAIHGDDERSEKIRLALRRLDEAVAMSESADVVRA